MVRLTKRGGVPDQSRAFVKMLTQCLFTSRRPEADILLAELDGIE